MDDKQLFDHYMRSLRKGNLEGVISSLEGFEDRFKPQHVVPGVTVLLNLAAELPERERGMYELDSRFVVGRVTYRLLRSLKDPAAIEAAVREILPELGSLSFKLELLLQVGHRENVGHKLVPENASKELEKSWRSEVRAASVADLIREPDVGRLLFVTKHDADPSEGNFAVPNSAELTLALLRKARTEVRSQTMGSRAVRRRMQLNWDSLVDLVGGEAVLRERIETLRTARPEGIGDLLELADKYLSGWRPNDIVDE
jgi:hypothetical protein